MRDAVIATLGELAAADPDVLVLSADLGFGVFDRFRDRFADQWLNVGIAEQNMAAMACGMALTGARCFTYSIANFPTLRCIEQLRNDVCYHAVPVITLAVGGGFSYGQLGMSHFATEDLAMLRALPGMTVVAPSDPWQAAALLRQMHDTGTPGYMRIDKSVAGLPETPVELGKLSTVRAGSDGVIFAVGGVLGEALAAADLLAARGQHVRVIDVHTIKPFDDAAAVDAVRACGHVVTLEEHVVRGGLAGAVSEACMMAGVAARSFRALGLGDAWPDCVGDQAFLRARMGLDRHAVVAAFGALS